MWEIRGEDTGPESVLARETVEASGGDGEAAEVLIGQRRIRAPDADLED